jgi:signal recognition particle GTPase
MFDGLQNKLQEVFRRLKGEGTVSREVLDAPLRQIRLALLEARRDRGGWNLWLCSASS